jgi:glutaconyl-CoA/methylmalonyl-CoA decarboxylase subunit gamma
MRKYEVNINDKPYSILVEKYTSEHAELKINGKSYSVDINGMITGVVDNTGEFASQLSTPAAPATPLQPVNTPMATTQAVPAPSTKPSAGGDSVICAPIPGSILVIKVTEGDEVKAGQLVLKMEAMKMENEITANCSGTITAIKVKTGDSVNQGEVLIKMN